MQVITAPDGWPIWTSQVRPGREPDTTAVRVHSEILPALAGAIVAAALVLLHYDHARTT